MSAASGGKGVGTSAARPKRPRPPPPQPEDPKVRRALESSERVAARAVLRSLRRRFGILGSAAILARVALARALGEPFASLGPPSDERDRLSRRQCGPVVLLARAIERRHGDAVAMEVAREVVLTGGVAFLGVMIPSLDPRGFRRFAHELTGLFFNATGTGAFAGDGTFRFEVTRCRFVELLRAVGASHLAPLFCETDLEFFDGKRRLALVERTQTLAGGAERCDFRFTPGGA